MFRATRHSVSTTRRVSVHAAVLLSMIAICTPVQAADDHGYRSLFRDQRWFALPSGGQDTGQSIGLYREEWRASDDRPEAGGDRYTGLRHRFSNGLGLDTGLASYGLGTPREDYREFYFGLSYDALQGRVWYTDDYLGTGGSRSYYEFGVSSRVAQDFSLSARLGYGNDDRDWADDEPRSTFILSAEKQGLYGFGFNLQLSGSEDTRLDALEDVRVMGILSRPIR